MSQLPRDAALAASDARPLIVDGMAALVDRVDGLVLDQWGVLHNGAEPYPGVVDCLARLRDRGTPLAVLSNQPRPGPRIAERLAALGIDPALFTAIVTSGDDARDFFKRRPDAFYRALGHRFVGVAEGDSVELFTPGLEDLVRVDDPAEAEFVLMLRTREGATVADYQPLLDAALKARLPAVCANPDHIAPHPGGVHMCPGAVAARYEAMGGIVRYHGKPHAAIYERVRSSLGLPPDARVAMVGDSLMHDIGFADAAGIMGVFVAGGIHLDDLGGVFGARPDNDALAVLCAREGRAPDWVVPSFRW